MNKRIRNECEENKHERPKDRGQTTFNTLFSPFQQVRLNQYGI